MITLLGTLLSWLMNFVIGLLTSTVLGAFVLLLIVVLVLDSIINFLFKEVKL